MILLVVIYRWIRPVLEYTATITTPGWCSSTPNHDPGPFSYSKVTDLDPTIPIESKPSYMIEHNNGKYELIYFSTEEQLANYFQTLQGSYCRLGSAPPACLMGHYPDEPPGREPCVVPTNKTGTNIPASITADPTTSFTQTALPPYPYPDSGSLTTPLPYPSPVPGQTVQPQTYYTPTPSSQLFEAPGGWFTLELPAAWKPDLPSYANTLPVSFPGPDGFFRMAYLPEMAYMRWATQVCERLAYTSLKGWKAGIYEVKGTGSCILFEKTPSDPGTRRVVIKNPKAPPGQRYFYLEADAKHIDAIAASLKLTQPATQCEAFNYQGGPLRPEDEAFWAMTGEFPAGLTLIESLDLIDAGQKCAGDALLTKRKQPLLTPDSVTWRNEPAASTVQQTSSPSLEQFGYRLSATGHDSLGKPVYTLYQSNDVVLSDIEAFEPMMLNPTGTEFWMILRDSNHQEWILQKNDLRKWDRFYWILNGPVFLGEDLIYTIWSPPSWQVQVIRKGRTIFSLPVALGADNPARFHIRGKSWLLEAHGTFVQDGVILNEKLGYEEMFDWRLLNEKPFYFFRKGPRVGISYDGKILPIWFEDVYHYGCCGYAGLNPDGTKYMVGFYALRDNLWRWVEIGFK